MKQKFEERIHNEKTHKAGNKNCNEVSDSINFEVDKLEEMTKFEISSRMTALPDFYFMMTKTI
jgi:hypothetical protein